jgi:nucleoid DNA-binding protein
MAKKAASKAEAPKKAAAKKAAPVDKAAARSKPPTKTELHTALAEKTGLGRKEVAAVLDTLNEMVIKELGKRGSGQFILPGLLRMRVVRKPATKARPGRNPFTGEAMTIKAKPARNVVRATPSKALKESV